MPASHRIFPIQENMKPEYHSLLLDSIPYEPDVSSLLKRLHLRVESTHARDFLGLLEEARAIARPKALYRPAYVEEHGADYIIVDGVRLSSRVLAVNLADTGRIFPFTATCGVELDAWASGIDGLLERFWADAILEEAVYAAIRFLEKHMDEAFLLEGAATMNPGSLEDWPLTQQRELFSLMPDAEATTGVRLTDSFLMLPTKSVSGIRFPHAESFESCQLCPRENCPNRRAPYDPHLYAQKFAAG